MGRLDNKVAIVTGAAGAGIGQATARAFAREGARVVVSDVHPNRPFTVAEDIQSTYGIKTLGIQCDVGNREQVENMTKKTLEEFGRIDILVNNAGIDRVEPTWEMSDETWELVINVNLRGTFYCCRAALPTMIKQKNGKIINLSSIVVWHPLTDSDAYVAAKAGVQGFTRALARKVAEYNITVNAIAPGLSWNPFLDRILPPEHFEMLRQQIPLGRDGTPQDMANAILFLASDEANYVTGACISVSGGLYMH